MVIPPKYLIDSEILQLITKIDALRLYFSSFKLTDSIHEKIQRVSLLKSSLFSARIEGNTLDLTNINHGDKVKKLEVFNIMDAMKLIGSKTIQPISKKLFLKLHYEVLKKINTDAGYFRQDSSAIFNLAGVVVYVSPSPSKIPELLDKLLTYINSDSEKFPIITAFISHLVFEKIHPFLDGNGRVGRLLVGVILKTKGWELPFAVPFEEYLDEHKNDYYFHLDHGLENTNDYLIFMLESYSKQLEKTKEQIEGEMKNPQQVFLPPRQTEILEIIKDHKILSINSIKRRFSSVPDRTLRYDLKKLTEKGFLETTGETRGRYYRAKK